MEDKIIIRQATGNISGGISDTGEHVIEHHNEYRYYDGQTGIIPSVSGKIIPEDAGEGEGIVIADLPRDDFDRHIACLEHLCGL